MPLFEDLTGQTFGYLTVKKLVQRKSRKVPTTKWLCHCVCGAEIAVIATALKNGKKTSCGCKTIKKRQDGPYSASWKGGRIKRRGGYIAIMCPDHPAATRQGYVREHRLVVEKALGRYLTKKEVVHHIDGDPANNDLVNLFVFPNAAAHTRWHKRLEEIALYD